MSYPKKTNAYDDSIQLYSIHKIHFYHNTYKNENKKNMTDNSRTQHKAHTK